MKLNFTVDLSDCEDKWDVEHEIVDRAAEMFLQQVFGAWDEKNSYTLLEKRIVEKMEVLLNSDFKMSVAKEVTKRLSDKFEKTKQYKALKAGQDIENDRVIKSGLRDLVADIVKSEMKNIFK